jgi:hypothetical protein
MSTSRTIPPEERLQRNGQHLSQQEDDRKKLTNPSNDLGLLTVLVLVSSCNPLPTRSEWGTTNACKHVPGSHDEGDTDGADGPCPFIL